MSKKSKKPVTDKFSSAKNGVDPATYNMWREKLGDELRRIEELLDKEEFSDFLSKMIGHEENLEDYESFINENARRDFDPVTTAEWGSTHPANLVCGSDTYYAELANEIAELVYAVNIPIDNPAKFARETGRVFAAYLEDIVSGTNVFSAMRRVCRQRYGYLLPFYDCEHEDYMPNHINEEDIRFLLWQTACRIGEEYEKTYSPLATGWTYIANKIFDVLNSHYEAAPEAMRVTDWLRRSFNKEDYIDVREIALWLLLRNPLTYTPYMLYAMEEGIQEFIFEHELDFETAKQMAYGYMASEAWQRSMSAMGCSSQTLVAALAAEFGYDELAVAIAEIEVLPKQIYAISRDKKTRKIYFETSDHVMLEVHRDSFAKGFTPDKIQYCFCILLKFKGEYLLNGVLHGEPSLKREWENQKCYLTLDGQREYSSKWIEMLDGKQVVCVEKLRSLLEKLGIPTDPPQDIVDAKNYIVLFSQEIGMTILPDMGYAFDLPGNRYYRKREAAKSSFVDVIVGNSIPYDLAMYIQNNHLLPEACIGASQGKDVGRSVVQDYLAFWIGFYCKLPAYGTPPEVKSIDSL